MKKRIGIDGRFFGEAGPGRYTKSIIEHLEIVDTENEYIVFLREKSYEKYHPKNSNFTKVLADYPWYSWKEQFGFLVTVLKYNLDLFYVPHFNIPVLYPKTIVTAIPDIIMHTYSTERGTTLPKPYFKFKKFVYKLVVWWAIIRSKKVIVPSMDVMNDFIKYYPGIPSSKYVLAYEGVDPVFLNSDLEESSVLAKYNIKKPFLLYVSSAYEHKNVPRLVEAFKLLVSRFGFRGQLVIVGKKDKFSEEIFNKVVSEKFEDRIIMPGLTTYVEDSEIVTLRRSANVYVFPSLKEGFSLTPLEAQIQKLPCAISDIPCHREIYEDSVVYFDPLSVEDIAETVNQVLTESALRHDLIEKGLSTVAKYSWKETADITYKVFQKELEG